MCGDKTNRKQSRALALEEMVMPYIRIWVHLFWTTQDRRPYLIDKMRYKVFSHIKEYADKKDIYIDHINGYVEHVHCLISLKAEQNISTIMNLLKGEASYWINNKSGLTNIKFGWQDEYFAVSVSESQVNAVRKYISNQERHHKKETFQQEYDKFMDRYNFGVYKG